MDMAAYAYNLGSRLLYKCSETWMHTTKVVLFVRGLGPQGPQNRAVLHFNLKSTTMAWIEGKRAGNKPPPRRE
jgi:hypothetical protein